MSVQQGERPRVGYQWIRERGRRPNYHTSRCKRPRYLNGIGLELRNGTLQSLQAGWQELTRSEERRGTLVSLHPIFLDGCNIMTVCVRRPSDDDISIIPDDTIRDEFLSDCFPVVKGKPGQYTQVTRLSPNPT